MSEYVHESHNVTVLIYHLVFPAKYRRAIFDEDVDRVMKEVCIEIQDRYQMKFLEIGTDKDHVHFLVQSIPTYSVTKIVTAREIFERCPHVKKKLWGGGVLDGRIFCEHGRKTRQRGYDSKIR